MSELSAVTASLAQQVAELQARNASLLAVLSEYISAADNTMYCADKDSMAAMLRFGDADKAARVLIAASGAQT